MQVTMQQAKDVFLAINMDKEVVDGWEAPHMQKKLLKLETYTPKGHQIGDARLAKLHADLVAAVKAGEDITIADGTPKPPARPAPKPPAKQPTPGPEPAGAKQTPKPPKAKPGAGKTGGATPKPAKEAGGRAARQYARDNDGKARNYHGRGLVFGNQGVGVIRRMVELLVEAGAKKRSYTRDAIHKVLTKEFKDRPAAGLMVTVVSQLPNRLRTVRGLDVKGDPVKGFWIDAKGEKATTEEKPAPAPEPAPKAPAKAKTAPAPKAKAKARKKAGKKKVAA